MTKHQAEVAMEQGTKVEGGKPGTEDYDTGIILTIDGDLATVAWNCGVRTPCKISDLRIV